MPGAIVELMMKLFYTPNSPYSRVARVFALTLDMPVEFVEVAVRDAAHELLEFNPAAKVPSLELEDGVVLSETRLICEHLESLSDKRVLATVDDHLGRHWEGLVGGFMDGIAVWVREIRRPASEQSPGILDLEKIARFVVWIISKKPGTAIWKPHLLQSCSLALLN